MKVLIVMCDLFPTLANSLQHDAVDKFTSKQQAYVCHQTDF